MTIEELVSDYWEAWYQCMKGNDKGPDMVKAARNAIITFHYAELDRVADECTPATQADLKRWGGR